MILKYLRQSVITLLGAVLLSSCLNSETRDFEASKDAQIYSFSLSSKTDSMRYLSDVKFSIDQLSGQIFNRDSLPYLFDVDSILISIDSKATSSFSNIVVNLKDNDSTYIWNGKDSISFHRIKSIETTAADQETILSYDISINIHQQDPYIFTWNKLADGYLQTPVDEQRTIYHNENFITYYLSNGVLKASLSNNDLGVDWEPAVVAGLPNNVVLTSIVSLSGEENTTLYILTDDGAVYGSSDGLAWSSMEFEYPVRSIFGVLKVYSEEYEILAAANVDDQIRFVTTTDFSSYVLWDEIEEEMPVDNFSALSFAKQGEHKGFYIVLYGGESASGVKNEKIWIMKEGRDKISTIAEKPATESGTLLKIESASLFYYDYKVYLLAFDGESNVFYNSHYGINWSSGGDSQVVDENFTLRKDATVLTDADNYMWIFGGKSKTDIELVDVWRGRLNKLAK